MADVLDVVYECGRTSLAHRVGLDPQECTPEQWADRPFAVPYCAEHGVVCGLSVDGV